MMHRFGGLVGSPNTTSTPEELTFAPKSLSVSRNYTYARQEKKAKA